MRSKTNPGNGWPLGSTEQLRGEGSSLPTPRAESRRLFLPPPRLSQAHDSRSMRLMQVHLPPGQMLHVRWMGLWFPP